MPEKEYFPCLLDAASVLGFLHVISKMFLISHLLFGCHRNRFNPNRNRFNPNRNRFNPNRNSYTKIMAPKPFRLKLHLHELSLFNCLSRDAEVQY